MNLIKGRRSAPTGADFRKCRTKIQERDDQDFTREWGDCVCCGQVMPPLIPSAHEPTNHDIFLAADVSLAWEPPHRGCLLDQERGYQVSELPGKRKQRRYHLRTISHPCPVVPLCQGM